MIMLDIFVIFWPNDLRFWACTSFVILGTSWFFKIFRTNRNGCGGPHPFVKKHCSNDLKFWAPDCSTGIWCLLILVQSHCVNKHQCQQGTMGIRWCHITRICDLTKGSGDDWVFFRQKGVWPATAISICYHFFKVFRMCQKLHNWYTPKISCHLSNV